MQKVGVIGAGAWGTALAQSLSNAGREVVLWAREPDVAAAINTTHENPAFLPGVPLNENIVATESLTRAADCDALLIVTPAQFVRNTLESLKGDITSGIPVVICAKGIELKTGNLMTQVAAEIVPNALVAILTGPTFAREIAMGLPAAVTLATKDRDIAHELVEGLSSKTFRPYVTDDVLGAQIGGAIKNVIAIASGVVVGKKLGESAKAALVTRGLAEMGRLASTMGAKKETLMGMCGMGDLMLTCSSMQSRNFSLGVALGEGRSLQEILLERGKAVTEGVHTAGALMTMARKNAVDMPIAKGVHRLVSENVPVDDVIDEILERPVRRHEAQ
ncbi:MAG: NAD(P)-dependent glycerol-3-phosphate dehydrogenase [Alphaproteobacteria bacterium]|nr:NAD(P)-dependent glycerol-3-phosphate dehydrogenase [Alphaproteobacteria bacterium]